MNIYQVLSTQIIKKNISPYLAFGNSWDNTKVKLYQVVKAIIYRLKTGCQWREIPIKQFFRVKYSWNSVYAHYRKWCKDGSWDKLWQVLLEKHKSSPATARLYRVG
ncbi:transposase [Marinilabiliaceae bacterium JC017]|nr:transposase [Marinilabiliaceae bacterium JC017]